MNDLERYFRQNDKRLIFKWMHYFDVYDRHFSRFRNKEVVILEIGVWQGGSLQMWKDYFGPKAKIYGIDIDPRCKQMEEENVKIYTGSSSDREFLKKIKKEVPKFDILIDDGGHRFDQQIATYEELFDHIKDDGVYLCEDLHTSYWLMYGGGSRRKGTFIEYSKKFIDYLNAHHSEQRSLPVSNFTNSVDSIHYYDSMLVIEKKKRPKPHTEKTGAPTFPFPEEFGKKKKSIPRLALETVNKTLRFFRLPSIFWK
jgi:23S rRNA U2552 (ribose-2'-O)-methylase RlmE/FtsJ